MNRSILYQCFVLLMAFLLFVAQGFTQQSVSASQPQGPRSTQIDSQQQSTPQLESRPQTPVPSSEQQPLSPNRPMGTATAPYERATGVAASRPAGAVIAPAKQRRVRTILIRVGIVAGSAAAVGAVAVMAHSSPSRP
jgi:hypothetical protein